MLEEKECPFCDGMAILRRRVVELPFRKEQFKVAEHYYECAACKETFTTTAVDSLTLVQVHNLYRERHHIPFSEEIIAMRESYDLSAAKMSEVLGLGSNGYGNYEKGEIPNEGYGNLIRLASDPQVFRRMLLDAKTLFSENTFSKALSRVDHLIAVQAASQAQGPPLDAVSTISRMNGFRRINLSKAVEAMRQFLQGCAPQYNDKLKLNKLLFYADFLNYRRSGHSITGISYRAIPYGPVPSNFDYLFAHMVQEGHIDAQWQRVSSLSHEVFVAKAEGVPHDLSLVEQSSIEEVINSFGDTPSWEMVDISHREAAWRESQESRRLIDYQQYAFALVGI